MVEWASSVCQRRGNILIYEIYNEIYQNMAYCESDIRLKGGILKKAVNARARAEQAEFLLRRGFVFLRAETAIAANRNDMRRS